MNKEELLNALTECMKTQETFNQLVNPDWRKARYNWNRAIWTECAELVDHLHWKWWKDTSAKINEKQALLEVVDIFHFVLSDRMLDRRSAQDLVNSYVWATRHTHAPDKEKKIRQVEELAILVLDKQNFESAFFQILVALDIDIKDMLKYYLGKNALNKFRQDNGYKEGTYQKQWYYMDHLVEDNVVLESIIETQVTELSFDKIYEKLNEIYNGVKNETI